MKAFLNTVSNLFFCSEYLGVFSLHVKHHMSAIQYTKQLPVMNSAIVYHCFVFFLESGNSTPNMPSGIPTMPAGIASMTPASMSSSSGTPRPLTGMSASTQQVRSDGQRAIVGTNCSVANDMTKFIEQQRLQQQQQQQQQQQLRQIQNSALGRPMGTPVSAQSFGVPITGRLPVQSNFPPPSLPPPVHPMAANALLMQQMMQRNLTPNATGGKIIILSISLSPRS